MIPIHHFNLYQEIEQRMRRYGLTPDKKFGQNFLADADVLDAMCDAARIQTGDVVLEVGPGVGTLTERLLARGATVVAVEKDERFRPLLAGLSSSHPQLQVLYGDALRVDWAQAVRTVCGPNKVCKVVANIPYYVTGVLLQQLLRPVGVHFTSVTILVQREVAQNMLGVPGRMSLLGLSVGLVGHPSVVQVVPAASFIPAPKVDSAVVHIALFPESLVSAELEGVLFRVAKACFVGKRKQIHNTLAVGLGLTPEVADELLRTANIDRSTRPQNLSVQDFIRLASTYKASISV